MPDILLTGMPRSGTTLATLILNQQSDTIALAEPIALERHGDRPRAVDEVRRFIDETRRAALAHSPLVSKHVDGRLTDNWVEEPNDDGRLRRVIEQRGEIAFDTVLGADFTLIVKHPAEFTALADLLVEHFPLFAVVRDPLAVLAAWQTVDMPVNRGHMPMAEAFAPELQARLAGIEQPLKRQVALIEWQLTTYRALPRTNVLRYEDIAENPAATLHPLVAIDPSTPRYSLYDPVSRYPGVDFRALLDALTPLESLIELFYPDFSERWSTRLY